MITLEKLAPYAIHKPKIFVSQKYKGDWTGVLTDIDFHSNTIRIKSTEKGVLIWKYQPLSNCKLYARPLSSLTKSITVEGYNEGKPFVPRDHLYMIEHPNINVMNFGWGDEISENYWTFCHEWGHESRDGRIITGGSFGINSLSLNGWRLLHKWHFAIDIEESDYIAIED